MAVRGLWPGDSAGSSGTHFELLFGGMPEARLPSEQADAQAVSACPSDDKLVAAMVRLAWVLGLIVTIPAAVVLAYWYSR